MVIVLAFLYIAIPPPLLGGFLTYLTESMQCSQCFNRSLKQELWKHNMQQHQSLTKPKVLKRAVYQATATCHYPDYYALAGEMDKDGAPQQQRAHEEA